MATAGSGRLTRRGGERRSPVGAPSDVGAALREARERLGVTLAEIRDRTGVSWEHLEALEAMDLLLLPDQRTVVTAARRYSEVVGLDASEVCGTVLRAWQDAHWTSQPAMGGPGGAANPGTGRRGPGGRSRRRQNSATSPGPGTAVSAGGGLAGDTAGGGVAVASRSEATGVQSQLKSFTQTAQVPMLGSRAARGHSTTSLHFAETGAIPITSHIYRARRPAPLWLRGAVAATALLLAVGVAGLAIHHYKPKWLADWHLTRGQATVQANATGASSQSTSAPARGGATSSSSHGNRGNRAHGSTSPPPALVTLAGPGTGSAPATATVHAKSYVLIVTTQRPCWVDATAPGGGTSPVFVGVLQPGSTKVISPVKGQLSVEFGASGVSLSVWASGKKLPGWTFSPPSAPFTVDFAQASPS